MATVTLTAPDPGFTGTRAGVVFRDGAAVVDADNVPALAYFARHGYAVDVPRSPAKKDRSSAAPDKRAAAPASEGDPPDA